MAYNEHLAERIRTNLRTHLPIEEKKMFGGIAFMVDDKMCIGIVKEELMVRINPDDMDELVGKKGARQMDFTGRPMKGFIYVSPDGIDREQDLEFWINAALEYNKIAKASKKRKK